MRKLLSVLLLIVAVSFPGSVKADDATLYVNVAGLKLYVPIAPGGGGLNTGYLWDINNKKSLLGAETSVANYKGFTLTGGAVTTLDGQGAPFARVYYTLANPAAFIEALNSIHFGVFGGKDFTVGGKSSYIYGIGASKAIW